MRMENSASGYPTRLRWLLAAGVTVLCVVCWGNGEWHERAVHGRPLRGGESVGKSGETVRQGEAPAPAPEQPANATSSAPTPATEAPQPSPEPARADSSPPWTLLLICLLWLLFLVLLALGLRQRAKGRHGPRLQ